MRPALNLEALVRERIQESLDLNRTMLNDVAFQQLVMERLPSSVERKFLPNLPV